MEQIILPNDKAEWINGEASPPLLWHVQYDAAPIGNSLENDCAEKGEAPVSESPQPSNTIENSSVSFKHTLVLVYLQVCTSSK